MWGRHRSETIEFAWRRRYGLPSTDPRYLDATYDEILIDYWAHAFTDDPKLKDDLVTDDFAAEMAEFEAESAAEIAAAAKATAAAAEAAAKPADDWEPVVARTYGGAR